MIVTVVQEKGRRNGEGRGKTEVKEETRQERKDSHTICNHITIDHKMVHPISIAIKATRRELTCVGEVITVVLEFLCTSS